MVGVCLAGETGGLGRILIEVGNDRERKGWDGRETVPQR